MTLPDKPQKAQTIEPIIQIWYSPSKIGKTSILSALTRYVDKEGKSIAVLIDLEDGARYESGTKLTVNREFSTIEKIKQLNEILTSLDEYRKETGKNRYKIGLIDSITTLDEWCEVYSTIKYMQSPQGKSFNRINDEEEGEITIWDNHDKRWSSCIELPNGRGYGLIRDAVLYFYNRFVACFEKIIFVGHIRNKIEEKNDKEVYTQELDLTGKLRTILPRNVDLIGKLFAQGNERHITFEVKNNDSGAGSRVKYLRNKTIKLNELKDEKLIFYWENIFPSLKEFKYED